MTEASATAEVGARGSRVVKDADGTEWTCAPAYAGLGDPERARQALGHDPPFVCTPRRGARSVRLAGDVGARASDDDLLRAIAAARAEAR